MKITPDTMWTVDWRRAEAGIRNLVLQFNCEIKVAQIRVILMGMERNRLKKCKWLNRKGLVVYRVWAERRI